MRAVLCILALLVCSAAQAQDISGTYDVEGGNPGAQGRYAGQAAVKATGDTFQVLRQIGSQTHRGTGILQDRHFSVVYQADGEAPGVAVYDVAPDGSMTGVWTGLGGTALGIETWRRR